MKRKLKPLNVTDTPLTPDEVPAYTEQVRAAINAAYAESKKWEKRGDEFMRLTRYCYEQQFLHEHISDSLEDDLERVCEGVGIEKGEE